jgi:hypothetical protein
MAAPTNNPVGAPDKALAAHDAFAASLARVAYSPARQLPETSRAGKRKSRFFFTLEEDVKVVDAVRKKQMAAKQLDHIDEAVESRLASYKGQAAPALKTNLEAVREFFLNEVAPRTLSASGGVIQATDIIQRMIDSEVDPGMRSRFDQMVNRAAVYKMGIFVTEYFGLPHDYLQGVMGIHSQSPQDNEFKALKSLMEKLIEKQSNLETTVRRSRRQDPRSVSKSAPEG